MTIYTKAKVVTDGVFQRGETDCLWHYGRMRSVCWKSGLVVGIVVYLQRHCRELLASSGRGKAEGDPNQMGSASGLCKFN